MELHNLKPAPGAVKKVKRIGRGIGSGHGGTATKGNKGAQSRAGHNLRRASEGGQMPIQRRVPKVGFKNINRVDYKVFNLDQLESAIAAYQLTEITPESLYAAALINRTDLVKILGRGEIKTKMDVKVHAISATAKTAIEGLGATVEIVK
jgi:large subunit ribosomal protein L15